MRTANIVLLAAGLLAFAPAGRAATNNLTSLLQQGLFEEEANRNLDAAISNYQALATQFDKDRQIAATAVFRLGECYRKLGKTNEAMAQYQRILNEFPDQQTLATLSQQNLAGLSSANLEARSLPALSPAGRAAQRKVLEDRIKLAEQDVAEVKKQFEAGLATQEGIRAKQQEVLKLRQQLAALDVDVQVPAAAAVGPTITRDEQQEIARLQAMIQNSPDLINAPDSEGTPLEKAAAKGQLEVARFLLDHGAKVNLAAQDKTPLFAAVENGQKAMTELLLSRGADVNAKGLGKTPLYEAVSRGFTAVTEVLLEHKADVNAPSERGMTPLHVAAMKGNADLILLLFAKGANLNAKDTQGETPLHVAATRGQTAAVKALLIRKADVRVKDDQGNTPLHDAARWGYSDIVELLLDHGAPVDALNDNQTAPLLMAVGYQHAPAVKLLLEHRADPNLDGLLRGWSPPGRIPHDYSGRPICFALMTKNTEILEQLLASGANPDEANETGERFLFQAIDTKQPQAVKLLLEHKADPNQPDTKGNSPLHAAINRPEIVKLLLAAKADPNVTDKGGLTPLKRAIVNQGPGGGSENPLVESVRLLVTNGADVNFRGGWATSALALAAARDEVKVAELLLAHGAEVNARDADGNTALHQAVYRGYKDMVTLLLANKADVNAQNKVGITALDLARKGIEGPIPYALLHAGADNTAPSNVDSAQEREIAQLLEAHGGLADLPKRDRIEVTRPASGFSQVVFWKGTNDWNRFSLLELIAEQYGFITIPSQGEPGGNRAFAGRIRSLRSLALGNSLGFPDFKHVVIHRPSADGRSWKSIPVDVAAILSTGDCSRDVWLQWGDAVEIPEADHPLSEGWRGLTQPQANALIKCVSRHVSVVIQGKTTEVSLEPQSTLGGPTPVGTPDSDIHVVPAASPSFMLKPVLDYSKLIRFSSDLTRVRVTRTDPETHQTHTWVVDCSGANAPDLWLRNGDVIEVPEKP